MDALAPAALDVEDVGTLQPMIASISSVRDNIETTFVGVGQNLSKSAGLLNEITKVFEALPARLQSAELEAASSLLGEVGTEAQKIAALFATEQDDLLRLVDVVADAAHPISGLRRAVKMMGIVAINARVVAAGVVGDSEDFVVFTTDIAKLSESATDTIQQFATAYAQLTAEVRQAALQRTEVQTVSSSTLNDLAVEMAKGLESLTDQRMAAVSGSAQTGQVTRQIFMRISKAVMALQVGDATRQRLEHVVLSLADLEHLLAAADQTSEAASHFIGNLNADQLQACADEFDVEVSEAGDALRDLAADARKIMEFSATLYGSEGDGFSALAGLSASVKRAVKVLRACEDERSKLERVASAVLATVRTLLNLVEAVQEIEGNMRLVSLNAAVKCAQLGPRGAALNVIARELRELTGVTVETAEAAMAGLHKAAKLAQAFGAAANGDTAGKVGHLEHQASEALLTLEAMDSAQAGALSKLNRDGPNVIDLLEQAASTFAERANGSESLRDVAIELAELTSGEASELPKTVSDILTTHFARYTMDVERQIHIARFGAHKHTTPEDAANDDAVVTAGPEAGASADVDDVFF
jgi:hypothetical protein